MNYVLYAVACYIIMRGLQVLFEEHQKKTWFRVGIKIWSLFTLFCAVAALIGFYREDINLLGFPWNK
jgi:hypothetical membrane protein